MTTTQIITPEFQVGTFPAEAGPCCCGGGGGQITDCWPGVAIPLTLTVTISDSSNEACIPNQTFQITWNGSNWGGTYNTGLGIGTGAFSHSCASSTWLYDASEAYDQPYDSEDSGTLTWSVLHTDLGGHGCAGATARFTVQG